MNPERKGLLKDTVDFSQYESDSPTRPTMGAHPSSLTFITDSFDDFTT